MTTIAPEQPEIEVKPGITGFVELAEAVGFNLEPFQRRIVKAALGPEREFVALPPRGQGKTCLQALVALHHLTTVEEAEIFCCASSRDQARILFQYAAKFARALDHPNVVHRHLELRYCPDPDEPRTFTRYLRVLPAEAPRLYGLTPSLMFLDEMQALDRDDVYVALSSALHKRPDSKFSSVREDNLEEARAEATVAHEDARGTRWTLGAWAAMNAQTIGRNAATRGLVDAVGSGAKVVVDVGECGYCAGFAGEAVVGVDPLPPFHPSCTCTASAA